jgi:(p)ppGpp synthase/HD superfamily hydrolase
MTFPCYSNRLDAAILDIAEAFRAIYRKGTDIPYITHLLQVMVTVAEHGGDEDQLIAALLHDYLEDIPNASAVQLTERYGLHVAAMVQALSDSVGDKKPPWEQRKKAYLASLTNKKAEVKLIAVADKLHNVRTIASDLSKVGESVWDRFTANKEQLLWYYRELYSALSTGWEHPLLDEFYISVRKLHELTGETDALL